MEPLISLLSTKYHCIAPCLRGHGYSSLNKKFKDFWEIAKDIESLMKDVLKIKEFYVVGHSMGGGVAMMLSYLMQE